MSTIPRSFAMLLAWLVAWAAMPAAELAAQSLDVSVTASGAPSGVPQRAAERLSIYAVAAPGPQLEVHLNGPPGKTAGLLIGLAPADLAFPPGRVLVDPVLFYAATFDAGGDAPFVFPLPNAPGGTLYMQGVAVDLQSPQSLFAFTWRLEVTIVPAQPPSTSFDVGTAETLLNLAWDAYEYPERRGVLREGMRLDGGFQVLTKISSPNPTSEPWFQQLGWPDTQLFLARDPGGDVALVFRGTDFTQPRDWATDLLFPQTTGFHRGFLIAYNSVRRQVEAALIRFVDPHARVYITGHSLGGGLAPLAAHQLAGLLTSLGVAREEIVLYSFAGPRALDPQRAQELGSRVPHHFAVVNKDDLVTHVPTSLPGIPYEHIPRMRVLYPRRAMVPEAGADYAAAVLPPLTPGVAAHYQHEYMSRLQGILPAPQVWLSVSSSGHMVIHWRFPERQQWGFARDFIALYRGAPDPRNPGGHVLNAWQWASSTGSYETNVPKGADMHVAYVQQYSVGGEQKILGVGGPYTWSRPRVALTIESFRWKLNWTIADPGAYDYVALYDRDPRVAGPRGYLLGQWQWATRGRSWLSSWIARRGSGMWIAYIEDDAWLGSGRVVAVAGPY